MSKVAVVYWSGTGNTEAMAQAVCEGAHGDLIQVSSFDAAKAAGYDAIAWGCPAMGAEELEDSEFAPVWNACASVMKAKKVALFGSFGWGGGAWMEQWEGEAASLGISLACPSVIAENAPDDAALANCKALGEALAK